MSISSKVKGDINLPLPLFSENEKVLCFHGPLIYEGKVIKVEYREKDGGYFCLIHYAGWSKTWDEYVSETRVLKWTPENLQRQKEHKMAYEDQVKSAKKASAVSGTVKVLTSKKKSSVAGDSASSANVSTTDSRPTTPTLTDLKPVKIPKISIPVNTSSEADLTSKKRKRVENVEPELTYLVKQEVEISLPEQLKVFLVDDWDMICQQKKLVNVPGRHTAENVLQAYLKTKEKGDSYATEICGGIRDYFNTMLGTQLLYRFERYQYSEIMNKFLEGKKPPHTTPMATVYGPIHLLRLFTKLGTCLSYTTLEPDAVEVLRKSLDDFFRFLCDNYDEYFTMDDYSISAPEYQRKVPA